ncbi:EscU/YscU/HrcU family type III secretion system export apparatus switch protein [Psychromarinibacter sp. S121]|uniref:EscU/YscU/HrcU family type III secretion system export apparatus switch protein n=1 Tax=Psychromarinibacter sp. S121 TaxID=3415127 RepID=UPI003C7D2E1A
MSQTDTDDSSKTEEPTERKLKKAREKGDVPTSKEVGHLLIYGALLVFVGLYLPLKAAIGASSLGSLFDIAGAVDIGTGQAGLDDLRGVLAPQVFQVGSIVAGSLGILLVAAMISGALQGPFVVSKERITPKLDKISPGKGIKRIASANNLVEFAKSFVKLTLFGGLAVWVSWVAIRKLLPGTIMLPEFVPSMIAENAVLMLAWIVLLMFPITAADIAWKRYSHHKKQRMSLKELRDDHKDAEGDPQIKGKRDQLRRARARQRMQKAVPTATLVVTNPTHFAVALRYERGRDASPVCVAKGTDQIAGRIRQLAHENEIPVIESRALARALHATCEIDHPIPKAHWAEVAELVAFVFDLRNKIRRKLPSGASHRRQEDEEA